MTPKTPEEFRRYYERVTKPKKWRGEHLDERGKPKKKDEGDK